MTRPHIPSELRDDRAVIALVTRWRNLVGRTCALQETRQLADDEERIGRREATSSPTMGDRKDFVRRRGIIDSVLCRCDTLHMRSTRNRMHHAAPIPLHPTSFSRRDNLIRECTIAPCAFRGSAIRNAKTDYRVLRPRRMRRAKTDL